MPSTKYAGLYGGLMEEIKVRLHGIASMATVPGFASAAFNVEFCYLQLRIVCEVIAIACLVAHDEHLPRLSKEEDASELLKRLGAAHPDFYPKPCVVTVTDRVTISAPTTKYLERNDLLALYARCDAVLHWGSLNQFRTESDELVRYANDVMPYHNLIFWLLRQHIVSGSDGSSGFLVLMDDAARSGAVTVATLATSKS